ncbi:podocalyxin isoform X2 [Pseudorasbora parva]|uniref:podocalyxin isoform X2 n=1 Tax=Pseudorasbora parva TaxID=51549 RepID=UPI00351F0853
MKMAITWTIVVLGALLHGMKCDPVSNASLSSTVLIPTTSLSSTSPPVHPTITSLSSTSSLVLSSSTSTIINESPVLPTSTSPSSADSTDSTKPTLLTSAGSPDSITPTSTSSASSTDSTKSAQPTLLGSSQATSPVPNILPLTSTTKDSPPQSNANDPQTEHSTTTIQPNIDPTVSNYSPQNSSATVISSVNSDTTDSSTLATTTHNENDKASINQRDTSATTTNPTHSQSTGSQNIQTTEDKTTTASKDLPSESRRLDDDPMNSSSTPKLLDLKDFDLSTSERGILQETCKALAEKLTGKCSVSLDSNGKQLVATVTINANEVIPKQYYQPQEKKADVSEETIPDTLVAILASCGALVLILCCFAAYCTYHRRSYRKNQQHLTEEMQTVENGYHDNPTLEVMEVVPEMQEKKLALNGEFNDSWIVPIDNLLKDDIPDEEDTHL